eukprot:8409047-Prorocentrum_lima.AAC.1
MTSSLVGSEMCIRDRCGAACSPTGQRRRGDCVVGCMRCERHKLISKPVSYTHLTLPTICSV